MILEIRSIDKNYKFASSGNDGRIRLWRLRISDLNGSCRIDPHKTLECQNQSVMSVRYSGDGKTLAATGGDKLVTLFDTVRDRS
jgi:WD40 repeat protein